MACWSSLASSERKGESAAVVPTVGPRHWQLSDELSRALSQRPSVRTSIVDPQILRECMYGRSRGHAASPARRYLVVSAQNRRGDQPRKDVSVDKRRS